MYAWLPPDQAGSDADTAAAVYAAMARSVPFKGLSLGPAFLAGDLRPRGLEPG